MEVGKGNYSGVTATRCFFFFFFEPGLGSQLANVRCCVVKCFWARPQKASSLSRNTSRAATKKLKRRVSTGNKVVIVEYHTNAIYLDSISFLKVSSEIYECMFIFVSKFFA